MEAKLTTAELERMREEARAAFERARVELERIEGLLLFKRHRDANKPAIVEAKTGAPRGG